MLRYCYIFCFLFLFFGKSEAQTQLINSLKKQVETARNEEEKLTALFALCEQRQSLSPDTLCKYASIAKQISINKKILTNVALAEYNIATCLVKRGLLDTALEICESNILKVMKDKNATTAQMKLLSLKAQILIRSTKYKEGIAEVYKVLSIAEHTQDTMMQMIAKNAIGWVNMEMDQTSEALKWFFEALNISGTEYYHVKNSNIYSNIAAVYKQIHKNDSAEYFIKKAIAFSRKNQNLFFLANCLNILADIYIDTKRPTLAEAPLSEALIIRKQIGDPFYIVSDLSQMAIYYANVSQPAKGIALSLQGIEMANNLKLQSKLPYLYHALGENYKASGDYVKYSKTLEKIQSLKDSMYVANSAEAKAEMDTKYDIEKKEKLIAIQKLDISNKNSLIYISLFVFLIASLIAWMLFWMYKKNQQIRMLKMQAEEKQLAARAVLSAEEKERKRISRDLHDNLGAYATVLMANTDQLKQQASGQPIQQSAEKVANNAQNIMGSLQETIWVLNNDVITVTDFVDRFKLYAKKMLQPFNDIQIRYKEQLDTNLELSPSEALHIFRIMQEALQNIIKHAKPKNILVTAESNETVIISIKDDGIGFDRNSIMYGNGLQNMQVRAKEAGYQLNIISTESGTEIKVEKNHSYAVL